MFGNDHRVLDIVRVSRRMWPLAVTLLVACSGNDGVSIPACPSPQALSVAGYSTGAAPVGPPGIPMATGAFPVNATYLYFSFSGGTTPTNPNSVETMGGIPALMGSDGSKILPGAIAPSESLVAGTLTPAGYYATVSGLQPNITYTVTFDPLSSLPFDGFPACSYMKQPGGSFSTTAGP